jgi:protein MpaA
VAERWRLRYIAGLALLTCVLAGSSAAAATRSTVGHSVEGRPIIVFKSGPASPALKVLVVGAIHGDEAAGMGIARRLISGAAPPHTELLVVPTLNPDGVAAHTRGNAHGVDLNRNFPYRWQPLGGGEYSGSGPLSEPESRAAHRLVLEEKPDVTIWFHQPFGLIDKPESSAFAAHRFAQLIGLPLVRLPGPYPGSISRWQNHTFPTNTAFVAELPRQVGDGLIRRGTRSVRVLAAELASLDVSIRTSPG